MLWNVHGLKDTDWLLDGMCRHTKHMLLLTETWTTKNSPPPHIPDHTCIHAPGRKPPTGRASGGICIYVSDNIAHHVKQCTDRCTSERLWVKVSAHIGTLQDTYIGVCYFPPKGSTSYLCTEGGPVRDPFAPLEEDLEYFHARGDVLLAGDFNARTSTLPDFHEEGALSSHIPSVAHLEHHALPLRTSSDTGKPDPFGKALTDLTQAHSLVICNGRLRGDEEGACTHRSHHTGKTGEGGYSLIDYFIADPELYHTGLQSMKVRQPLPDSDHFPIDLLMHLRLSPEIEFQPQVMPPKRKFKVTPEHLPYFQELLTGGPQRELTTFCGSPSSSPDEAAGAVYDFIIQAAEASLPKAAPPNGKDSKSKPKPWYDRECKKAKSLYRHLFKSNSDSQSMRQVRKEYRTMIRCKRRRYEDGRGYRMSLLASEAPAKFWKAFKSRPAALKITNRDTWFSYFQSLLQAPAPPPSVALLDPRHATSSPAAPTGSLSSMRRSFRQITMAVAAQELNGDIKEEEVLEAIKKLKRNKAVGVDGMQADLIISGKIFLAELLTALFNKVFHTNYPKVWTVGLITPIFKKGDPLECCNYRGVTVGVALAKLYAIVLNKRLSDWTEKYHCRAKAQAGFRKDYRCADNLFILRTLLEKSKSQRTKLYCCFVDFSKAFDTIPRARLWRVLEGLGIHGDMFHAVQSIYETVQARVKTPEGYTDTFDSEMGVLQGCVLSPLLFGLFLDPLEKLLLASDSKPPKVLDQPLPAQFFADDSQLLSTTPKGLQTAIDTLQNFCEDNGLAVNVSKTKIMVFGGETHDTWTYNQAPIEIVGSYKNLGLNVTSKGKFSKGCASQLAVSATKAQHGLFSKCTVLNVTSPPTMLHMFDALVRPILCYGCEVWGVDFGMQVRQYLEPGAGAAVPFKTDEHEAVQKYFIKRVLEVCPSTPDMVIYGEVARLPLAFFRLHMIIKYWNRLCTTGNERLLKKSFLENVTLALRQKPSWCLSLQTMLAPFGFVLRNDPQPFETDFVAKLKTGFIDNFLATLNTTTKLKFETYNNIRSGNFLIQPYLQGRNRLVRKCLARFRTGSHWLEIQRGRFTRTDRENRLCKKCNLGVIEDEAHMVFVCPMYAKLRVKYSELFLSAKDLNSALQSTQIAGFVHECWQMHAESEA
jgi:hypothetical protein